MVPSLTLTEMKINTAGTIRGVGQGRVVIIQWIGCRLYNGGGGGGYV